MYCDRKKAVVEDFESHDDWNVPCILEFQRRLHIDTKDLQKFPIYVNRGLDRPEHIDMVGQYKKRPTYDIYTDDFL